MVVVKRTVVDYKKVLNNILRRIEKEDIGRSNKILLKKLYKKMVVEGLSYIRIARILNSLLILARNYNLRDLTDEDVINILYNLRQEGRTDHTIEVYVASLKKLYTLLGKKWNIKVKLQFDEREDYLDFDTVLSIIKNIDNEHYRVFTMFLYDTGCRPSEAFSVMLKNIRIYDKVIIAKTTGKTGIRDLYVSIFYNDIKQYVEKRRKENAVYLFDISYDYYLRKVLKEVQQKLNLPVLYPYIFRHSRATDLANVLTEQQLKKFFGWSQNSKMLKRYIKQQYIEIPVEKLFAKKCVGV